MQLARLIEPRESRSIASKITQMFRAWQIERRIGKREILERYLTLAPYGGNLEGIRAAALAYFGKEPKRLTSRKQHFSWLCRNCRSAGARTGSATMRRQRATACWPGWSTPACWATREAERAASDEVAATRFALPALAAHLADDALRAAPAATKHQLTLQKRCSRP